MELTISHLPKTFDTYAGAKDRKIELKKMYNISCSCVACTDEDYKECRSIFLCPRCHGKTYMHEVYAQCTECLLCFNALPYLMNDARIKETMTTFMFLEDVAQLNLSYEMVKKTYHRHSIDYVKFYCTAAMYYFKKGNIKKSVDWVESCLTVVGIIYKDWAEDHCTIMIFCTYILATYCKLLKKEKSPNHKKYFDKTKQIMKTSASLLEYTLCTDNIRTFIADIIKYLNSDYIDPEIDSEEEGGFIVEEYEQL